MCVRVLWDGVLEAGLEAHGLLQIKKAGVWEDVEGTAGRHGLVHLRASFEGERVLHLRPTVSNHMTSGKRPLLRVWFLICVVNQCRCRISPRAGVWGKRELPGSLGGQVVGGWHQRSPRVPAGPYSSGAAEWG